MTVSPQLHKSGVDILHGDEIFVSLAMANDDIVVSMHQLTIEAVDIGIGNNDYALSGHHSFKCFGHACDIYLRELFNGYPITHVALY